MIAPPKSLSDMREVKKEVGKLLDMIYVKVIHFETWMDKPFTVKNPMRIDVCA